MPQRISTTLVGSVLVMGCVGIAAPVSAVSVGPLDITAASTTVSIDVGEGLAPLLDRDKQAIAAFGDDLDIEVLGSINDPIEEQYISARAQQDGEGNNSLSYSHFTGGGKDLIGGYHSRVEAVANYTVTNNGTSFVAVDYSFTLNDLFMEYNGLEYIGGNPFTSGFIDSADASSGALAIRYRIRVDSDVDEPLFDYGGPSLKYGADHEAWSFLLNESTGYRYSSGRSRGFSPIVTPKTTSDGRYVFGFEVGFAPLSDTIRLGLLRPGASISVLVGSQIETYANDREPFFNARMSDPAGFGGPRAFSATAVDDPAPVPLPAAIWALLIGLASLAGLRTRRPRA